MPFTVTFPNNTTEIIDSIRTAIGREVEFIIPVSSYVCPTCGLDPVTNTALNSFCPTCSGEGTITVYSGTLVSGHVTWNYSELLQWQTGGRLDGGDCRVQVKYTLANETLVDNAKYVIVDGRQMQIIKRNLRGAPQVNRILIDLIERSQTNE